MIVKVWELFSRDVSERSWKSVSIELLLTLENVNPPLIAIYHHGSPIYTKGKHYTRVLNKTQSFADSLFKPGVKQKQEEPETEEFLIPSSIGIKYVGGLGWWLFS